MKGGDMESVKKAVAVEIENPTPELYAVEEQYRRIVEEVATYVTEGGGGRWKRRNTASCTAVSESSTTCPPS